MYVTSREACKRIGIHPNTLRRLADNGGIDIIRIGNQRRYNVDKYLGDKSSEVTICYCRVSSHKQKDDLLRQVEFMREHYPKSEICKDIGSGLNFKRKGLISILERAMSGDKLTVVVAHRDRLARFGIDLIRYIIERNDGKLVVLSETSLSPEAELSKDLLNIVHIFSCRMHGLRSYKKQISEAVCNAGTEEIVHKLD